MMPKILFIGLFPALFLVACAPEVPDNVSVDNRSGVICTTDYTPGCAQKSGINQTFSNRCVAEGEKAIISYEGPCNADVKDNESPTFCTKQYDPVCAEKEVQCIKAPCYPVRQTYGNACEAGVAKARIVYEGECRDTATLRYIAIGEQCDTLRFECDSYQKPFFNEIGCGCEPVRQ